MELLSSMWGYVVEEEKAMRMAYAAHGEYTAAESYNQAIVILQQAVEADLNLYLLHSALRIAAIRKVGEQALTTGHYRYINVFKDIPQGADEVYSNHMPMSSQMVAPEIKVGWQFNRLLEDRVERGWAYRTPVNLEGLELRPPPTEAMARAAQTVEIAYDANPPRPWIWPHNPERLAANLEAYQLTPQEQTLLNTITPPHTVDNVFGM